MSILPRQPETAGTKAFSSLHSKSGAQRRGVDTAGNLLRRLQCDERADTYQLPSPQGHVSAATSFKVMFDASDHASITRIAQSLEAQREIGKAVELKGPSAVQCSILDLTAELKQEAFQEVFASLRLGGRASGSSEVSLTSVDAPGISPDLLVRSRQLSTLVPPICHRCAPARLPLTLNAIQRHFVI